jgi:hypothetical protein
VIAGNIIVLQLVFDDGLPVLGGGGSPETPVTLSAARDFDPHGDQTEHPEVVELATDGDRSTSWTTETYGEFTKPGVGIVLDAGRAVELTRFRIFSDTPGFTVEILAGSDPGGPFQGVSDSRQARERTEVPVDSGGAAYRWYVVWITSLDGVAHLNEVRAFRRQ